MYPGMRYTEEISISCDTPEVTKGTHYPLSDVYYMVRVGEHPVIMPRMKYEDETEIGWKNWVEKEMHHDG